jgi:hypothetical protein
MVPKRDKASHDGEDFLLGCVLANGFNREMLGRPEHLAVAWTGG